MVERRTRAARFPAVKSLNPSDFPDIPSVNKALVIELARCEYIERRENIIAVGNSGTGKTHIALGRAACQRGMSVGFTTATTLVHELMEARDERRRLNLQRQLSRLNLLIIDERTEVFGAERLTGALLDRLTHHVHILEMNGESYRLQHSREASTSEPSDEPDDVWPTVGPLFIFPDIPSLCCQRSPSSPYGWATIPPPRWYVLSPPLTPAQLQ